MEINREELLNASKQIKFELTEKELDVLIASMEEINNALDLIFDEDTNGVLPTSSVVKKNHDLELETLEEEVMDMNKINNYNGEYLSIKKENDEK